VSSSTPPSSTSTSLGVGDAAGKSSSSISTVISLLSTLCRGSPGITHALLRSELPDAIERAVHGDERCILDTMRLVDLLLVLLFEGRRALPRSGAALAAAPLPAGASPASASLSCPCFSRRSSCSSRSSRSSFRAEPFSVSVSRFLFFQFVVQIDFIRFKGVDRTD